MAGADAGRSTPGEQWDSLAVVLDLIRSGLAVTKPELARETGHGRTAISLRLAQLADIDLIANGGLAMSSGGRAARELSFRADRGCCLVAELGATGFSLGIANLRGEIVTSAREAADIAEGPEPILDRVQEVFDELLTDGTRSGTPVWGVGIGVPGPVEYRTGRPVAPPIMPGWDDYPIRERFEARYRAPVWVDNDVNLMALGEFRAGLARGESDLVYVKVGSGIGAGLISNGRLHRGAKGVAGDLGHVEVEHDSSALCRCGNYGCLEAIAGGAALVRAAIDAAAGSGGLLADRLGERGTLVLADLLNAAGRADRVAVDLLSMSAARVGQMLATVVNLHNPSLIIMGGAVATATDAYLAGVREVVLRRSLPLATRDLTIATSPLRDRAGLLGAAFMVLDELFSPAGLASWVDRGSPVLPPVPDDRV
ncbi:MAG: ROK family protein [Protaetiibacter sp.]